MPQFTDLPQAHGWGNWHVNRFRVAFRVRQGAPPETSASLAAKFIAGFPGYVHSPAATVTHVRQGSEDFYKFNGAVPIVGLGVPHFDWVRVIWKQATLGFAVQTLHRDTADTDDAQMTTIGGAVGLPAGLAGAAAGATTAFVVNRFHILAGRRSWLLRPASPLRGPHDPQLPATDFILETAAVERISIPFFLPATGMIEKQLPPVWQNLLANFVINAGLEQVRYAPEAGLRIDAQRGIDVHWYALDFKELGDMGQSPYAVDVLHNFRHILDMSQPPTHELQQLMDSVNPFAPLFR